MLLTNQRLDKLEATYVDFMDRGMLEGTCLSEALKTIGERLCSFIDQIIRISYFLRTFTCRIF